MDTADKCRSVVLLRNTVLPIYSIYNCISNVFYASPPNEDMDLHAISTTSLVCIIVYIYINMHIQNRVS